MLLTDECSHIHLLSVLTWTGARICLVISRSMHHYVIILLLTCIWRNNISLFALGPKKPLTDIPTWLWASFCRSYGLNSLTLCCWDLSCIRQPGISFLRKILEQICEVWVMLMASLQAELCPILFHFLYLYFLSWYLMFGMFFSGPHKGCCQSKF